MVMVWYNCANHKCKVVREVGKVEIQVYPKIVIAKVEDPNLDAFSLLYSFITIWE